MRRPPLGLCRQCRLDLHVALRAYSTSSPPPSRPSLSQKTAEYIDTLQFRAVAAGQRLNDFTGYTSIESLKLQIEKQQNLARSARTNVINAKQAYNDAVTTRAETQRELTNLLNRKTNWSPDDLARFTRLYPTDHSNEATVQQTMNELSLRERESEEASAELGRLILSRYHEEQIWSDKIRRASTWGTFLLMGVNLFLFGVVQIGLEPWRRRRLVAGFEEKVREVIEEKQVEQSENGQVHGQNGSSMVVDTPVSEGEHVEVRDGMEDGATLVEETIVGREDAETSVLENPDIWISAAGGAVAGGLVTALATFLLSR